MSKIHNKIKVIRANSGMTQDDFASALGVKPSKVRDIESGRQRVNDEFLTKLVEIFPVDMNWLFSGRSDDLEAPSISPADGNKPLPGQVRINSQEYSTIGVFDVDAAAGNGIIPVSEAASDMMAFTRSWLMRHGVVADLAGLLRVRGDSMSPTIPDGAYVLVDFRGKADWSVPGIYIVRYNGAIVVKRLQLPIRSNENWVAMISDNATYPPIFIHDPDDVEFQPIARVRGVISNV
ncbi:XRE family transcriptional regulator [Antarcticimicrobium sediminis]|nr:XRE family transcriptional regulator [Antarcticimicrobium sediminis]